MTPTCANFRRLILTLSLAALATAVSCASNKPVEEAPTVPNAATTEDNVSSGDSDSGKAMGLQSILFPYDSYTLTKEAKGILKANAAILKGKAGAKVQIEGHCDERGGIQYNIALGEKRANAGRKYLVDLGVSEDRLSTISYGKERPSDPGHTEEAWAKNRRDNFAVTSR